MKETSFEGGQFADSVTMIDCIFNKKVSFQGAVFHKTLSMYNVQFKVAPSFYNTQLPKVLLLSSDKLDSLNCVLNFTGSKIDTLEKYSDNNFFNMTDNICRIVLGFKFKDFEKIILPSQLFTLAFLSWEYYSYDDRSQQYEELINQSKNLGMTESTKGWQIEYMEFQAIYKYDFFNSHITWNGKQYSFSYLPLGTLSNLFNKYWWNFGFSKSKILFIWLPFFYLLFTIINYFNLDWMVNSVYNEGKYGRNFQLKFENIKSKHDRISFSIFYTAMIFFNFRIDSEAVNYRNLKGFLYLYVIYIVGTIHVSFGIIGYIFK